MRFPIVRVATIFLSIMNMGIITPLNAEWKVTLEWSKVVVPGGGLSYSDEGPFRCFYDGHKLTKIKFFDWNGDSTGVSINFTGQTDLINSGESGNYIGVFTVDSIRVVNRFATYDRAGNLGLEWTERDSLNPLTSFMVYGSGHVLKARKNRNSQRVHVTVYEPDGTPLFTVSEDSICASWISNDGERLYVPVGCKIWGFPLPERERRELRVYDVESGTLMYTLPRAPYYFHARDTDVIALWNNQVLTVYSDGVSIGSPGNLGGVGLSPNGEYLIGTTPEPSHIAAYEIETMIQLWAIADSLDTGEQDPCPDIGNNGVAIYTRKLSGSGYGITVVAPTGDIIFEQDYPNGASGDLLGDGAHFVIERYDDHVVSYYSVTEE